MQLSYSESPAVAYEGMIADAGYHDIISKTLAARHTYKLVITTQSNSEDFTVTINGTAYTITSDSSGTKTEIRDALEAEIEEDADAVVTVTDSSTDALIIEAVDYDTELTISVTNPATGVMTLTELVGFEVGVPFGHLVCWNELEDDQHCRLPRVTGDIGISGGFPWGVAVGDSSKERRTTAPYGGYSHGDRVPIMRKGRIWVVSEDAVTAPGTQAYVRFSASGSEVLGAFRTDADTSDAAALTGARFMKTCSAGGLTVLSLNL